MKASGVTVQPRSCSVSSVSARDWSTGSRPNVVMVVPQQPRKALRPRGGDDRMHFMRFTSYLGAEINTTSSAGTSARRPIYAADGGRSWGLAKRKGRLSPARVMRIIVRRDATLSGFASQTKEPRAHARPKKKGRRFRRPRTSIISQVERYAIRACVSINTKEKKEKKSAAEAAPEGCRVTPRSALISQAPTRIARRHK
jgi:hypothetical protein